MLIDWFTVGAQTLNFLILVWLMKRFLYQPILHAIDEREQRIAAELAAATAQQAAAQKERDDFQKKNEELDGKRAALMTKAAGDAKIERQRLLEDARKAADSLTGKRQESLKREQQNLQDQLTRRTQDEVFAIARKALTDLATTSLEDRISEEFIRRLHEMDDPAKGVLGEAIKAIYDAALVRSAFELSADQRAAIQNGINETFSANVRLQFQSGPDVIGGIELSANGQKVAWSIAGYLAEMEKSVGELMEAQAKPAAAEPKPEVAEPKPTEPEAKAQPKVQ